MTETLIGPAAAAEAPALDAGDRRLFETAHGLEARVTAVMRQRDDALVEARAAHAEAAAQFRVNCELQRHLDEYNSDRRAYEQRIADLEAEVDRLRGIDTLVLPRYQPKRRGWRRVG